MEGALRPVALRPRLSTSLPLTVADTMQNRPQKDQASQAPNTTQKSHSGRPSDTLLPLAASLGPGVEALHKQAQAVLSLTDRVRGTLPDSLKSHLLSATYHDDALVLTADSAAWGTHLRYQETPLREHFLARGEKPFTVLKVRVRHP